MKWLNRASDARRWGLERTYGPSADFSTGASLEPDFNPPVRVHDDGHRVSVIQGLVQRLLGLVNAPFFVLDSLATPRVAQPVAGRSNGKSVDDGNVGHKRLPTFG